MILFHNFIIHNFLKYNKKKTFRKNHKKKPIKNLILTFALILYESYISLLVAQKPFLSNKYIPQCLLKVHRIMHFVREVQFLQKEKQIKKNAKKYGNILKLRGNLHYY